MKLASNDWLRSGRGVPLVLAAHSTRTTYTKPRELTIATKASPSTVTVGGLKNFG